jgi:asparagine synthase (glutamine-hydrolysing)
MSGICAVWRKSDPARLRAAVASVAGGLALRQSERLAEVADQEAGVAVSSAFATQQIFENDRVLLACDADLYDSGNETINAAARLARLYESHGPGFVEALRGSFSLVIWDRRERMLVAAVDGFGVNRLVYCETAGMIAIASRLDALTRAPGLSTDINPRAIANFLNFGVSLAPETIFRNIRRLPPGSLLTDSGQGVRVRRYWDMRYGAAAHSDEGRLSRELEQAVEQSVAANCKGIAFSEVGAYLSGGTDSSTVVGMMSRLERGPVEAFSIGFEEERFNELEYAEIAARKFRARHHVYRVTADDCLAIIPDMVRFFDEPFANSSAIPTYFCARLAAESGMKALLAGDGGDELFGGNERYRTDKIFHLYQALPRWARKGIVEPLLAVAPVGIARRYVRRSNLPPCERFFSYNLLCAHPPEEIFEPDFLEALDGYSVLEVPSRYYDHAPAREHLDRLLYLDVKITLGDSDLPKVTQMSELAGIRTRFPFLDRAVAEVSGKIPVSLKLKGLDKRYLFKRAFRNLLPREIIQKKKHGFGIPVATWLKSDKRLREFSRDILFSTRATGRGYFRRRFLEELIASHAADESTYYGDTLWTFFVLELWHRQYVDQPVAAAV